MVRSRAKKVTGTGVVKKRKSKATIDKPKQSKPGKIERYVK